VSQSQLDAWVRELPGHQAPLRAFVGWAVSRHYLPAGLEVPAARSREVRTARTTPNACNWHVICCANATTTHPSGSSPYSLCVWPARHPPRGPSPVRTRGRRRRPRVTLALSSTPLRLREPLAGLALRVADDARARDRPTWLFPSSQGKRVLSADRLRERIAALDVDRALHARNGALNAFAAQMPPALLADQLGLSLSAATLWSKAAGPARSDYVGLRRHHT
jgi:hypothetical protein